MAPAPVGHVAGAVYAPTASAASPTTPTPPSIYSKPAITTPYSNRSGGISSDDTNIISPSSKSLDALADDFLSSKPQPIILRPNPLPRGEVGIVRLRTLVERRAWGDVLKLASILLNNDGSTKKSKSSSSSKSEQYSKVYASLLLDGGQHDGVTVTESDNNGIPSNIRQETVEIMMLQCNAWLKLRRYGDLSKEVERWIFLKQNDVTAPSIEWLPWGIRKSTELVCS